MLGCIYKVKFESWLLWIMGVLINGLIIKMVKKLMMIEKYYFGNIMNDRWIKKEIKVGILDKWRGNTCLEVYLDVVLILRSKI